MDANDDPEAWLRRAEQAVLDAALVQLGLGELQDEARLIDQQMRGYARGSAPIDRCYISEQSGCRRRMSAQRHQAE